VLSYEIATLKRVSPPPQVCEGDVFISFVGLFATGITQKVRVNFQQMWIISVDHRT